MNKFFTYKNKDYAMMVVFSKGENHCVYVDLEDVELVRSYTWNITSVGYVYCSTNNILMHRLIVKHHSNYSEDEFKNLDIDHKDHNTLNNTKKNLRVSTRSENCRNRQSVGKSGVSNIRWRPERHAWYVEFKHYGSKSFKDFFSAFDYRNKKAKELYGEFAYLPQEFELYYTNCLKEVALLESQSFHYILCSNGENGETFVYILSEQMKELLGHEEEK